MSWQPIHSAAKAGNLPKLKVLLKEQPDAVDLPDGADWSPLMISAQHGKLEAMRFLLDQKASIDKASAAGQTALQIACVVGYAQIAKFLLDNCVELDKRNSEGETALMQAVAWNRVSCVKLLLDCKADMTGKATAGEYKDKTALDIAQDRKFDEIVSLLAAAASDRADNKEQEVTFVLQLTVDGKNVADHDNARGC